QKDDPGSGSPPKMGEKYPFRGASDCPKGGRRGIGQFVDACTFLPTVFDFIGAAFVMLLQQPRAGSGYRRDGTATRRLVHDQQRLLRSALCRSGPELLRNVGDGRGQAASDCWLTVLMPSMNFTPVISFGNWLWPSRRRQLFSAACASLKTMAIAVLFERHPLERTVRCRTVANVLSMGLVVRRCFQCSAGKS